MWWYKIYLLGSTMTFIKKYSWLVSLLLIALSVLWSFSSQLHSPDNFQSNDDTKFSQSNALKHLEVISKSPHFVGAPAHKEVQQYIVNELQKLGLDVEVFKHLSTDPHRLVASNTQNIVAKINGSGDGKALAVVSHYDSATYSSLGASDAGSGVVTILEGVRAFLANGQQPKNDIIIVITDAEEQGLLGAGGFVNFHPWAKDVGLAINFEARGSGGSSYMLIETNGGNKNLIKSFSQAGVSVPVANSLMYAVYKLLPNDTDLTVFREQADIDGFNFAFIDDHFDYHTAQDSVQRLDKESLNHQADYMMATINHFAFVDLSTLKSQEDMVYFNFPALDMLVYPNSWVTPMFVIAAILFALITAAGFKQNTLSIKGVLIGFIPMLVSIFFAIIIGYFGWKLLLIIFPQYLDIPHGFTYNGHWILAGLVSMSVAAVLLVYHFFNKRVSSTNLFFAPILLWLIINMLIAWKLPGAGFLIIPVYLVLICFGLDISNRFSKPSLLLLTTIFTLPSVMLLTPLIPLFVVGLGLKMSFVGTLITALVLMLLIPVLGKYPRNIRLMVSVFLLSLILFVISATQSSYSEERKKPTSINYIYDVDSDRAFITTNNRTLDEFTSPFFQKEDLKEGWDSNIYPEHRRSKIRHYASIKPLEIKAAKIDILKDESIKDLRTVSLLITPQRNTNIIQLATTNSAGIKLEKLSINGQVFQKKQDAVRKSVKSGFFFKYVLSSSNETVHVELTVPKDSNLLLKVYETTFDLFEQLDDVEIRSSLYMPEPFILTDAIIIGQSVTFENKAS